MRRYIIYLTIYTNIFLVVTSAIAKNQYRDKWQQPEKIMDIIGLKPGMIVGEAGAGDGYFTFKLAKRVGPSGLVYANDIDESELEKLKEEAQEKKINNIEVIVGEVDNPLFPDSLDMVIMVYVFHHLDKPIEFFNNMTKNLKPNASVVMVESDPKKHSSASGHFFEQEEILDKIKEFDYHLVKVETFLERDNIYIIKPNE